MGKDRHVADWRLQKPREIIGLSASGSIVSPTGDRLRRQTGLPAVEMPPIDDEFDGGTVLAFFSLHLRIPVIYTGGNAQ
jgi:hypothetical protein